MQKMNYANFHIDLYLKFFETSCVAMKSLRIFFRLFVYILSKVFALLTPIIIILECLSDNDRSRSYKKTRYLCRKNNNS